MRTMSAVGFLILALAGVGAAGWWAWHEHRTGSLVLPPSGEVGVEPGSLQPEVASSTPPRSRSGVVDELPRGSGRTQGSRRSSQTRTGLARGLQADGSMRWMRGARSITFGTDAALMVTVTASVERGRFRVYLGEGEQYRWTEAVPGQALEISGHLITGTSGYFFYAETVGGRAEGIRWTVRGTSWRHRRR